MLCIVRIPPVIASTPLTCDHHLADSCDHPCFPNSHCSSSNFSCSVQARHMGYGHKAAAHSLPVLVDWWDALECTQCAVDDGIGVQTGPTMSNGGPTQVQAWVQGAIAKISATTPSAEVLASATIPSTNLVGPVVPLPLSVTTSTPAVHAPYWWLPLPSQEAMTGVQGSAATVVEVEDGDQIVNHSMATITKGSEEVANPQSAWVGYGNCGQGYSSEEFCR